MAAFDFYPLPVVIPEPEPGPEISLDQFVAILEKRAQAMRRYWEAQRTDNPAEAGSWPLSFTLEEWDMQFAAWVEMGEP